MRNVSVIALGFAFAALATPAPARADATTVPLFTNTAYPGNWGPGITTTATFPDAATMRTFDKMTVTMDMACPAAGCGPWDFVANLYVCRDAQKPSSDTCTTEIARWITAYGRPGKWTTDITPMLSQLQAGGKQAFYFWTPQAYTLNVSVNLDNTQGGAAPDRAVPLFQGGDLNLNYNPAHKPMTVHFDAKPRRAQLFALVTGHGWGNTAENCAEFCNVAHHFGIGGKDYAVDFPNAGTATGCRDLVSQGVVPDQAGTWEYGRDGWCPGWDVHPFVVDVTDSLHEGDNDLTYEALVAGKSYNPTPVSDPAQNAIGPFITLSSYLVVWDAPITNEGSVGADPNSTGDVPTPGPNPSAPGTDNATGFAIDSHAGCNALDISVFAWLLPLWLFMKRRGK